MNTLLHSEQILVTHMQRFSLHDGPGIRTTIFLKGCPLRCPWCCNPESLRHGMELAHQKHLCLGVRVCGLCLRACPRGCFQDMGDAAPGGGAAPPALNRQRCDLCMTCARACPAEALAQVGQALSPFEIMEFCRQDMEIYTLSGGGVTLSGGEPLARPTLTLEILRSARELSIHCALETCGWFDMDNPQTRAALEHVDMLIFDLKHSDGHIHQTHTGVDTTRIHCNLRRLARDFPHLPLYVRTAVIPGFNACEDVLRSLADLASSITTVRDMELVSYHTFGFSKYACLGRPQAWEHRPPCQPQLLAAWQNMVREKLGKKQPEVSHAANV